MRYQTPLKQIKTRQTNIKCTRKAKYAIVVLHIIQKQWGLDLAVVCIT